MSDQESRERQAWRDELVAMRPLAIKALRAGLLGKGSYTAIEAANTVLGWAAHHWCAAEDDE